MKTRQRQQFWRLERGAFGLRVMMLMLVMLVAGTSTAWANRSWNNTYTDDGGGNYRFKGGTAHDEYESAICKELNDAGFRQEFHGKQLEYHPDESTFGGAIVFDT